MITWNDLKKNLKSISSEEMTAIDSLAYLHAQRIKQHVSQTELANRIGMKQPQIARIESMQSISSFHTLAKYASGLGLVATVSFKPVSHNTKNDAKINTSF
jgi:transcriptional regulator with XRE-family HTH domain